MNVSQNIYNFPSDVLKWMKLNASPRISFKLMQVCKYFQHSKFPYFVIKNLDGNDYGWEPDYGWRYQTLFVKNYYYRKDLSDLPDKLWIIGELNLFIKNLHISILMPKIAICDVWKLCFIDQDIVFEDFKILTEGGKVEVINMDKSFINYANGKIVPLENVFDCLPNVKRFEIFFISNSFVSADIATTKVPQKLKEFGLYKIRQDFYFDDEFLQFVLCNQRIYFPLHLDYSFTTDKIKTIVDRIIQVWSPNHRPPSITFQYQTNKALDIFGEDYRRRYFQK